MPPPPVDPELLNRLNEAETSGNEVKAAFSIRRPPGRPPNPADIQASVHAAVQRAGDTTNMAPTEVNVLSRMAVAYVTGPAPLLRALLDQPEITGAIAAN